jgi:hypothetical protein
MLISRRTAILSLLAAPFIVRTGLIMPVRVLADYPPTEKWMFIDVDMMFIGAIDRLTVRSRSPRTAP